MTQVSDKSLAGRWSPTALLILAGALGLLARAWTILHTARRGYAVDDLFDALAWNLASLGTFTTDGTTSSAHVGPLYPVVLAAFYSVAGHRPEWVQYLHVACDVGTSFCIFRVGARLFGPWSGAIAAAAMFLYPAYWTYDPRIRSEGLLTLLMSACLWMSSDPLSRGSWPMSYETEAQIWESAGITPLPYAHAMYDVSTDRLLRAKGWARITDEPVRYLWLTLTRAFDFWIGNSFYL